MSLFLGHRMVLEPAADARRWTLCCALHYRSDVQGRTVVVPKGFVTDGASVPRLFWNLIPPWGRYGQAAVVHDYLYATQTTTRRLADDTLLEAMRVSGCGVWSYAVIYLAVRMFGWMAWRADRARKTNVEL